MCREVEGEKELEEMAVMCSGWRAGRASFSNALSGLVMIIRHYYRH